jgi:hypothetical protein
VALRRREDLDASRGVDRGRLARRGGTSAAYAALVLGAVVLLVLLSSRVRREWDASASAGNSLSPQTLATVRGLGEDVSLTALYSDDRRLQPEREGHFYLLQRYRRESPRLRVEFVDPVSRPGRVRELGLDPEQQSAKVDGITVVTRGTNKVVFEGSSEEKVTNALLEVSSGRKRVVGFLRGYAERDPASAAPSGFVSAAAALRAEYYEVTDVVLAEGIPSEVTVLVAAGPATPIPPADLDRLGAWLGDGGRLLALLEPDSASGLEQALEPWGLRPSGIRVLDPTQNLNASPELIKVTDYSRHPVVEGFGASLPTAIPLGGEVEDFESGDPKLFHQRLLRSSKFSIGLAPDGVRRQGPFSLGAASWRRHDDAERETRVILVGDADFAGNAYLPAQANRNFFLNCVGWLSRAQELVSVRGAASGTQTFSLSSGERRNALLVVLAAPLALVLSGIAVFVRRRGL